MAEKSNKQLLLEAWKEYGNAHFNETFKKISDTELENLKRTIKKMDSHLTHIHNSADLSIAYEHY